MSVNVSTAATQAMKQRLTRKTKCTCHKIKYYMKANTRYDVRLDASNNTRISYRPIEAIASSVGARFDTRPSSVSGLPD